ncbi:MAG: TIR domain-containing protein [Betaproteobacteria bacterium]
MRKLSIFLSHINLESTLADALKAHIVRDFIGLVGVFESSDRTSIPVGSKWLEEVTEALHEADLHIVLCSPESIGRPWINFEAGAAHVRQIPIVPICHSGLMPAQLPVPLSEYEGVVLTTQESFKAFYASVAKLLGSDIPQVDFAEYAREIQSIGLAYLTRRSRLEQSSLGESGLRTIINPIALCISSNQFLKLGFENQLDRVIDAFPATVEHGHVLDSAALKEALNGTARVDIVHIAAFICPRSGDLYFSDVDLKTGDPAEESIDRLTADAFAALLKMARTQLVIITSCDSISLAATVIGVAHVVAARDMVSAKMMAAWVESFYAMLPKRPLSEALDFALKASGAPMRLYAKQPESVDLVIELSSASMNQDPAHV